MSLVNANRAEVQLLIKWINKSKYINKNIKK